MLSNKASRSSKAERSAVREDKLSTSNVEEGGGRKSKSAYHTFVFGSGYGFRMDEGRLNLDQRPGSMEYKRRPQKWSHQ
jgi:hypothetical protein